MRLALFLSLCLISALTAARADLADPYEQYVKTSKDFRPVKQEKAWLYKAFPSWTYMPWTYQWTIGYGDAAGKWSLDHGYNGAFVDWDHIDAEGSQTGRLDWINHFGLHFYVDHTAGKHHLHLWDGGELKAHTRELHGTGVRTEPVNSAMADELHQIISRNIRAVQSSPFRSAYALDDEISWGHFVHPTMWRITGDPDAYNNWLKEIYGPDAPQRSTWVSYNDIQPKLKTWNIGEFDASPLMDQWTFNDSYWLNFIGDLVEYANSVDPQTPCGLVGGQNPSPFGGYDYAKLMRKVQFIEAYNIGSSQAIIRSFNPRNAIPTVTSHFHHSVDDDIWQTWYYLAHGNRGMIGWVEKWFDGNTPKPWHDQVAPTYLEADHKIGPLISGAEWMHDGIALYYSHPSIQLGWILDADAHGKTWINRNGDDKLGASHHVRHAWESMLRDEGLQYNFINYADVIRKGIPNEYRVLILPACLCLSDVEARRIKDFCASGGTVIADYLPGVWDQHGKGRTAGGALDDLFGIRQDPKMSARDVFGGRLWCEVDQDANFSWKSYRAFLTNQNTCIQDPSGFNKALREMPTVVTHHFGKGVAVLMNLSPQWYNAYRLEGQQDTSRRSIFMDPIRSACGRRWVALEGDHLDGYEITYWKQGRRTILFVTLNPEIAGSSTGGGNSVGLKSGTVPVSLVFSGEEHGVRDERAGKDLGDGGRFDFQWKMNEALVVSFNGDAHGLVRPIR